MQGRWREAKARYTALCDREPGDARAWGMLGMIHGTLGDLAQAEACCRRGLAIDPDCIEAHCNLGVVLQEKGDLPAATVCYEAALRLRPTEPMFCYNLGSVLAAQNETGRARILYEKTLALDPTQHDARLGLGALLEREGRLDEARIYYEHLLHQHPTLAEVHFTLGNLHLTEKRLGLAEASYRETLRLDPRHARGWNNLGNALVRQGRNTEAAECFERVTQIDPRHAGAWNNLGNALNRLDRPQQSTEALGRALQLKPDYADAWNNLGMALCAQEKYPEAMEHFHKALALDLGHAEAYRNAASLFGRGGRYDEAIAYYEKAVRLAPQRADGYCGLGSMLIKSQRLEEGLAQLRAALKIEPDHPETLNSLLFNLNYSSEVDPQQIVAAHREWAARLGRVREELGPPPPVASLATRRLRVGYVSGDFRNHSVAYFLEPILAHHDRRQVEIFCYSELARAKHDVVTARFRALAEHWIDTKGLDDRALAARMREDAIDVLVDLAGHTGDNRLLAFAYRPAPVQISYLGYVNTTGLPAMDYRLTDAWADPEGSEALYTERLARLPRAFFCYAPPQVCPAIVAPPALGAGHVTFGSFNNLGKITSRTIALWARLLLALPNARLLCMSKPLKDPATCKRLYQTFETHGVGAEQLILRTSTSFEDYLEAHSTVDIAVDSFPHAGHTVTCHALWMGVPVITLAGNRYAGRLGVSVLENLGLSELIAQSESDYIDKAMGLATDLDRLTVLRAELRARFQESGLCDGAGFTRELEEVYRNLSNVT